MLMEDPVADLRTLEPLQQAERVDISYVREQIDKVLSEMQLFERLSNLDLDTPAPFIAPNNTSPCTFPSIASPAENTHLSETAKTFSRVGGLHVQRLLVLLEKTSEEIKLVCRLFGEEGFENGRCRLFVLVGAFVKDLLSTIRRADIKGPALS